MSIKSKAVGKAGRRIGVGTVAWGGLDGVFEYSSRRSENPEESRLVSTGVAASVAAGWMFVPAVMWGKFGIDASRGIGGMVQSQRRQSWENQFAHNDTLGQFGGGFEDTEFGHTSRQRGMQAIQNGRLDARSALSNEARSLHRF